MNDLSVAAYKKIITRGLGKAILVLENSSDIAKYKETVLWACLHNTCYDAQCEGSRARYLYEILSKFDDNRYFQDKITIKFETLKNDVYLFEQLTELLFYFAKDDNQSAANTLYKKYNELFNFLIYRKVKKNDHPYCAERDCFERLCIWLRELGGFKAFKKIVDDLSAFYKKNKSIDNDPFNFDWFYENAKDKIGSKKVSEYLDKAGITYEFYCYTKTADSTIIVPTVEEVIEACKKPWANNRGLVVKFAKHGSQDDLNKLAQAVIAEKAFNTKANMLWAFTMKAFPANPALLIEYSKSENNDLRENAFYALEIIKSDHVRNYALSLLKENRYLAEALSMLCVNFQKTDGEILTNCIKRIKVSFHDNEWHGVFSNAADLLKKNKNTPLELLRYLYEETLCAFCREYIVLAMDKRKYITIDFLQECQYDCNFNIRKFAYKRLKSN